MTPDTHDDHVDFAGNNSTGWKRITTSFQRSGNTPLWIAVRVILVVLGGEFIIMAAIEGIFTPLFGKRVSPLFWEFLDPILLSIIVAPALHFLVFRPMKEQQIKLEKKQEELGIAAVTFNAQDGVIVTDENHTILKVNQAFTNITGYSGEEAIGKTPTILQSGRQNKEFYRLMRESLKANKFWEGEIWNRRKNGEIYPEWLTITSVTGETGKTHYVGIFSDISKRKLYEEKISFMAYHDKLTELPTRELFYDCLSRAMSQVRRKQDPLALFFLDLDGFKAINDTYGHVAGDEVLKTIAKRVLSCVRDVDTVARLGGDEFAIILSGIENSVDAASIAEKIIRKLSVPMMLRNGHEIIIGVSIGIAVYPQNGAEIDKLLSAADTAMYESKASGKNTYTFSNKLTQESDNQDWIVLDKSHLLGIPELDRDHIELAGLLNKLNTEVRNNASHKVTSLLLDKLASQIRLHFLNEDRLMAQYGYSDDDAHKNEHKRLIDELGYLRDKFNLDGEMVVLHSLKEWLLSHISNVDKPLGNYILQHRTQ